MNPSAHPSQVADAAAADGLHQLVVGWPHGRGWPAALLPSPLQRHGPQRVLELLQDATRLVPALLLQLPLLALLTFRLCHLLAARLVRLDDLGDHPGGLLLPLRERWWRWWRGWGRRRRWRWRRRRSRRSLFFSQVAPREFGGGPGRGSGWAVGRRARSSFLEIDGTKKE